jgi:hypothetical protein
MTLVGINGNCVKTDAEDEHREEALHLSLGHLRRPEICGKN